MSNTLYMKAVFEALLPDGAFWRFKPDGDFDKLLSGMGDNAQEMYDFLKTIAYQRDPYRTELLSDLEKEYGLITDERLTEEERRDQLASIVYAKPGTGSYDYLQERLNLAGFDVIVTPNDPAINPNLFIGSDFLTVANGDNAYAGYHEDISGLPILAVAGYGPQGAELLVNGDIFVQSVNYVMQANGDYAYAGNSRAVAGYYFNITRTKIEYTVPKDPYRWNYIFFVGGEASSWPYQYTDLVRELRDSKNILFYHDYLTGEYRDFGRLKSNGTEEDVVLTSEGATFPLASSIITIPDKDYFTPANLSIVAIIKTSSSAVTESVTGKYYTIPGERSWLFEVNSSNTMSFTTSTDGAAQTTISSTTSVNDDSFHTVGISKSGTAGTFYFDGSPDGSGTVDNLLKDNENKIGIGARIRVNGEISNNFSGTIKLVLVVNRKLEDSEHLQLHNELSILTNPTIERAQVLSEREEMFKRIILQYKPLHSWSALVVDYS